MAVNEVSNATIANLLAIAPTPVVEYNEVGIVRCENGFIIEVGCKRFVGKDWREVSGGIKLLWENPQKAMRKYLRNTRLITKR